MFDTARSASIMLRRLLCGGLLVCPLALAAAGDRARNLELHEVHGGLVKPFAAGERASVVFFVATDCPVSNGYAPEIQRVCREYSGRGVGCSLIYEDIDAVAHSPALLQQVRAHLEDFKYSGIPAALDEARAAATVAKASITPTAIVV